MEKWFKKLSGIFFAALVTASLSGKAKADNEDASLPEPAPTAVVAPASAPSAPAASAGSSGSSG
ncbi:MAG: hypothetical protein IKQ10_02980, partial [Oscillospiraceae bacterium]|nr:hypothetical protein [Oscillospiraceae bacterium]